MQEDNNTKYEPGQKPQALEEVQSKHRQETTYSCMERLGVPEQKADVPKGWSSALSGEWVCLVPLNLENMHGYKIHAN